MNSKPYHYPVRIYYEDTDHSGMVYHVNYLKFFERAREEVLGVEELVRLWEEEKIGYVVYKANLSYNDSAIFGDLLDIRTTFTSDGKYRSLWRHEAWRPNSDKSAVTADIQMVCLDKGRQLQILPYLR